MGFFAGSLRAARAGHPLDQQVAGDLGFEKGGAQVCGGQGNFRSEAGPVGLEIPGIETRQQRQADDRSHGLLRAQ